MNEDPADDDLRAVRALLPEARIEAIERLPGSERCSVHRVRGNWPNGDASTAIAKQFHAAGEGWARETAALSSLPGGLAPSLLAVGAAPPIAVMSDLGAGPSVADALLGDDFAAAALAVRRWAEALAALHVAARPLQARFAGALAERQGDLLIPQSRVTGELAEASHALADRCVTLGVDVPTGALDALRGLGHRLGSTGAASLSPADACPDNNVLVDGRYRLIDFEGAQWRHVSWDVAYLFVPWPTCWCSWRIPDDVAAAALVAYREAVAVAIPEVADDAFQRDLEAATVGWALTSTTWFLGNALASDPVLNPDRPAPTRRAMILHRLGVAAAARELPELAELADALAAALRRRWDDVPLAPAPAFRHPVRHASGEPV